MRSDYLLPRTQREYQRQSLQARVWARATQQALQNVGLALGGHALDVGCGGGDAMPLLAERVGAHGCVTGVDVDTAPIADSLAALNAEGPHVYRFIEADITAVPALDVKEFDLVFARLILFHVQQPVEVLRKLWSWVRPGGSLLVMDYDLTSASSFPQHPAIERALRLATDAYRRAGRDIEIGSRMPALFAEAGLKSPDSCDITSMIMTAAPSVNMLRELMASLQPLIMQSRLIDEAAFNKLDKELAATMGADTHVRWPDMVATWKRKAY